MSTQIRFSPIIHSRTLTVDFRDNFMTVPEDFTPDKIRWARKYVLQSTRYMEFLEHGSRRNVVFSDGEHCVIGLTVKLKDLCKECGEELAEIRDSVGRPLYVFLGFVCKAGDIPQNCSIEIASDEYLGIYKKYVAAPHKWKETVENPPDKIGYSDNIRFDSSVISLQPGNNYSAGKKMSYRSSDANNKQAADYAFTIITGGKAFSFCTNMANLKMARDSDFDLSTCSDMGGEGEFATIESGSKRDGSSQKYNSQNQAGAAEAFAKSDIGYRTAAHGKDYDIKEVHIWGDIVRLTLIIGGIVYLVTMPIHSIPLAVIVGGITISLSVAEVAALLKRYSSGGKSPSTASKNRAVNKNTVQNIDKMLNSIPNSKITYGRTSEEKRDKNSPNKDEDIFTL